MSNPSNGIRLLGNPAIVARYVEDFPKALAALFQAVQASRQDMEALDAWYSHSHSLALKFFRHLSTVQHLCNPRIDAITKDLIVDHSSVISVSRAAYETFLIFSHIFGPEDAALRRLRFALWSRAGLMERTKFAKARSPEQVAQLKSEQEDILALSSEIDASPLIGSIYSDDERRRMRKGEWSGVNKIRDLAAQAGLHEEHFQSIYKHSSGHSHSSYISALQVTQARDLETQYNLAIIALGNGLALIAYFLEIFCKLSPKAAAAIQEDEEAKKVLHRWNIQEKEWTAAKATLNGAVAPTWADIVRGRGNRTRGI